MTPFPARYSLALALLLMTFLTLPLLAEEAGHPGLHLPWSAHPWHTLLNFSVVILVLVALLDALSTPVVPLWKKAVKGLLLLVGFAWVALAVLAVLFLEQATRHRVVDGQLYLDQTHAGVTGFPHTEVRAHCGWRGPYRRTALVQRHHDVGEVTVEKEGDGWRLSDPHGSYRLTPAMLDEACRSHYGR
ncbi:hypothetical protein [Ferrimonas balearica]|uniref:hypothetical protein n=1 Tax=Ferrimonas balearica TaxID=44012 RepID=UPI001C9A1AF0|nr:hypothetical protein [Ferrimonas balearica]MBY5993737.1 hypothetical protein [Ferrimonas balearica]